MSLGKSLVRKDVTVQFRGSPMRKAITAILLAVLAACGLSPMRLLAGVLVSQDLGVSAYTASAFEPANAPQNAFDGNVNDHWNSGTFPTQWLEVDLQQRYDLTSVSLFADQLPDGNTTHQVWVSNSPIQNDLSGATLIHTFSGFTTASSALTYALPSPLSAQFVQVRTTESPSWVAWREVQVFAAIPEPSTLTYLGSALLMIGGIRLLRRRRTHGGTRVGRTRNTTAAFLNPAPSARVLTENPLMNRTFASLILLCATWLISPVAASAVTIAWSPVGNPGNANDPLSGIGAVPYSYRIGTYDVTNGQYAEFLNTKDPSGANLLGLWSSSMATPTNGGISFNVGNPLGSRYSVIVGGQDHPVNFVTWYDAIRFANWLNNGQGSGDTETGAYTLGALDALGVPVNGNGITRNAGATIFLPSENEWYKAAYYNPGSNTYDLYATSSSMVPNASVPTATPNSANYNNVVGNLTDVGAYTGTTSPYGAFDMGGNVDQWNETSISGSFRGLRGGSFDGSSDSLQFSNRLGSTPAEEASFWGFRVANIPGGFVPEPSTGVLAALACGLLWWKRKSFRRVA
jgi:formylglycine-generating enzyme required for sulfatase activity